MTGSDKTPVPWPMGCRAHGVTRDAADAWWTVAADRMGSHVSVCCCCSGPAPMIRREQAAVGDPFEWDAAPYCKKCDEGMDLAAQQGRVAA